MLRNDKGQFERSLNITMTNDLKHNSLQVYDTLTHLLVQEISTHGRGGVSGNAHGIKAWNDQLLAVVNNGSRTVSIFERKEDQLIFKRKVKTTSPPVSIDFGHGHMYVACATTVESFRLDKEFKRDGSANLVIAEGGSPPKGSTAQVGVMG